MTDFPWDPLLSAFTSECAELENRLGALPASAWALPTRCTPWDVRELLGHVRLAVSRVSDMVAALDSPKFGSPEDGSPEDGAAEDGAAGNGSTRNGATRNGSPGNGAAGNGAAGDDTHGSPDEGRVADRDARVSAAGYYRADERFSEAGNAARIEMARSALPPSAVLAQFSETWRRAVGSCTSSSPSRTVHTRHDDPMRLDDFIVTRIVEVAVHGIDLADALSAPAWLTPPAAAVIQTLLLGPDRTAPDPLHFIKAATGRTSDPTLLATLNPRQLALG